MKGKMEITLGVAIGSSIQIAVGVVPILVLVSWAIGRELTLYFENFETICFFIAILLVNIVVGEFHEPFVLLPLLIARLVINSLLTYPCDCLSLLARFSR